MPHLGPADLHTAPYPEPGVRLTPGPPDLAGASWSQCGGWMLCVDPGPAATFVSKEDEVVGKWPWEAL